MLEAHAAGKLGQSLGERLLSYFILEIHELENFGRCTQRLLEVVIKKCELADRIVEAEDGSDEGDESSGRHLLMLDPLTPEQEQQSDPDNTKNIHQRRTNRGRRNRAQVSSKEAVGRITERRNFPALGIARL